jgi:hypothetical protein
MRKGRYMNTLMLVLIFAGWFVLLRWVLPRLGVPT